MQFQIARLPGLLEPGLQRPVEAQKDTVALARRGLDPVPFIAGRRFRSKPDGDTTVGVLLDRRKGAVDPRQFLVGREERTGLVVVDREGPEILNGDGRRQSYF